MPKKSWRLLAIRDLNPVRSQAIYHAMAMAVSETPDTNVILLTTIKGSCLCCGFHQNFYEEVDLDYCKKNNIKLVRRMAGGGLVLLEKDQVFFNVILSGHGFPSPIRSLYSISLRAPDVYLKNIGLNSWVNYNEIVVNERKISGTAAASIENAGVVVGNILLDFDLLKFSNALNIPSETFRNMLRNELEKNITTLNREMNTPTSLDEVIFGLKKAFESVNECKLIEDELTESEIRILEEVEREYKQDDWNFRKRDKKNIKRTFIKIKKGLCLVHHAPENADFLISDEIILQVNADKTALKKLVGLNINKVQVEMPEFKNLGDLLKDCYQRSNV
ncbi:MAG: lipoate--protein ligase family protein [Candidatus Helarchaeota archaeon]